MHVSKLGHSIWYIKMGWVNAQVFPYNLICQINDFQPYATSILHDMLKSMDAHISGKSFSPKKYFYVLFERLHILKRCERIETWAGEGSKWDTVDICAKMNLFIKAIESLDLNITLFIQVLIHTWRGPQRFENDLSFASTGQSVVLLLSTHIKSHYTGFSMFL